MGAIGLITEMCLRSPDILAHFRKVIISKILKFIIKKQLHYSISTFFFQIFFLNKFCI